jgi:ubiquinone/menaquinone biosynthesis C-methylase UbiE
MALWDRGAPASAYAFDPAAAAIEAARRSAGGRPIRFGVHDARDVPLPDDAFDFAILRGVLHHAENPPAVLREAFRLARNLVVLEPNGYNPALKVIERLSPYHRRHRERSFAPKTVERWTRKLNGRVLAKSYIGLVPFFCPTPLARALKLIEPVVERTPGIRVVACAVFVMLVGRDG